MLCLFVATAGVWIAPLNQEASKIREQDAGKRRVGIYEGPTVNAAKYQKIPMARLITGIDPLRPAV